MNRKVKGVNKCNQNSERSQTGEQSIYGAVTQGGFPFKVGKKLNEGRDKQVSTKWGDMGNI